VNSPKYVVKSKSFIDTLSRIYCSLVA